MGFRLPRFGVRRLQFLGEGTPDTVFAADAEVKRTVCIEPASYNRAAVVTVKPGESHVFTMDLAVEKL